MKEQAPPEGLTPRQLQVWNWNHSENGKLSRQKYWRTDKGRDAKRRQELKKSKTHVSCPLTQHECFGCHIREDKLIAEASWRHLKRNIYLCPDCQ